MSLALLVVLFIVIGYVIYTRKKDHPRANSQKIDDLVAQQMNEIDDKIASLSLTDERLCIPTFLMHLEESKANHPGDRTFVAVMDGLTKEVISKYSSYIQPDEAFIENGEMIIWSEHPGCFERHLQRRYKNILFPIERRDVSINEILEARRKDELEQKAFYNDVKSIGAEMERLEFVRPASTLRDSSSVQKVQALLKQAASIGGNIQNAILLLETSEKQMLEGMVTLRPDLKDQIDIINSLSSLERNTFIAQSTRAETPILPEEQIASLLCEDLDSIALIGYQSRAFAPKYKPNETDIIEHLDDVVRQGFSKDRAKEIVDAWNNNR